MQTWCSTACFRANSNELSISPLFLREERTAFSSSSFCCSIGSQQFYYRKGISVGWSLEKVPQRLGVDSESVRTPTIRPHCWGFVEHHQRESGRRERNAAMMDAVVSPSASSALLSLKRRRSRRMCPSATKRPCSSRSRQRARASSTSGGLGHGPVPAIYRRQLKLICIWWLHDHVVEG